MSPKSFASKVRWCALILVAAVAAGCGGGPKLLSDQARPLGLKLHAAVKKMDVSDMAGIIETAERMAATNQITQSDLDQLRKAKETGQEANWNVAVADLEVMLGMRK